jgi:hypothetical protein
MKRRRIVLLAAGVFVLAAVLPRLVGGGPVVLDDRELASLRGGMAPTSYCNPHASCTGATLYCSDATPGANVGDPCTPAAVKLYYHPEHCSNSVNDRPCGQTSTVEVYCFSLTNCVTAFSGTEMYCAEGMSFHQKVEVTTDLTRCRNLFLVQFGGPPTP